MRLSATPLIVAALTAGPLHHARADGCDRPAAGSQVQPPADIYSSNGELNIALNYLSSLDDQNRTLFCFVTSDGHESPTLHVNPGDRVKITLTNHTPRMPVGARFEAMAPAKEKCGDRVMQPGSVNMHFHGTNEPPTCHADEVLHTMVNPGQSFDYSFTIPKDEPPGLYWYHPHIHGIAGPAVLGGASGVIEVQGIQNVQPEVANLPARFLVFRDQVLSPQSSVTANLPKPSWDVSLNYVPISYPAMIPAVLTMKPGQREFWRVTNAAADTIADLRLTYDGVIQPLQIVALDGVPTGSQDGTRHGKSFPVQDAFIPPAGRAEFIVPPLPAGVKRATLETLRIVTGPAGDIDTRRTLAVIQPSNQEAALPIMPAVTAAPGRQRFEDLDDAKVTATRRLYFYEIFPDPQDPDEGLFYIVVDGQTPELFDPSEPPAITTTQGAVEDWIIENRTNEVHEFHIHQIHFQVRAIDHVPVAQTERQLRDTYQVPYWTGKGSYPSVTLRMDFRGKTVGDFVYHCHILDHEDAGMMAVIRVLPRKG